MSAFFDTTALKKEWNINEYSDKTIEFAEEDVLQRYLNVNKRSNLPLGTFEEVPLLFEQPSLIGYRGTISEPKLNEMPNQLIKTIRRVVSEFLIYEHTTATEYPSNVESISQGDRSINFTSETEPKERKRIFKPLMKYDRSKSNIYL